MTKIITDAIIKAMATTTIVDEITSDTIIETLYMEDVDNDGINETFYFEKNGLWHVVETEGKFKVESFPYSRATYESLQAETDFEFVNRSDIDASLYPNAKRIFDLMREYCLK